MNNSPAIKPKNSIKTGQIVQLGDHFLACGDSTDPELVSNLLEAHEVSLILTDPPYGVDYVKAKEFIGSTGHKEILNDEPQSDSKYRDFTTDWLALVKPSMTAKNSLYIFNSDRMIFALREGMIAAGFRLSQLLIWAKTSSVIGRLDYLPQHELIAYGWTGAHEFKKGKDHSVIVYPRTKKNNLHPTMKPVGLLRRLILNSSNIGDFVYDPFGGSGSTLIACEQTKRRCLMIEKDEKYCQVIIDRFNKLTTSL
ncbi:site-specific DNA-methyltransferase [Candidatus Peregrinibacteria bacterium]|jgi:DNA modification methylase|nr:site-specific DNA-methyltransferase [Candidatus Peregrinibacteria bacterium]MBT7703115.1 site-specific DNA-methyltransferase [Candidatus Peregrinibacteria bacterium]